jgi:hypothetical protein
MLALLVVDGDNATFVTLTLQRMDRDADNSPLSTEGSELLTALRARVRELMRPRLQQLVSEMTDHLFTISGSAQLSSEQRANCFESFSILKTQSGAVNQQMMSLLDEGFGHLCDRPAGTHNNASDGEEGKLDLVDLEEFEDRLAINKIVKAGTDRYWLQWEAIVFRVAEAVNCDPRQLDLPFSIKALCRHYRKSIEPLDLDRFIVAELDRAFARSMLPELGKLYSEIGEFLSDRGLLPDIEQELERSGSKLNADAAAPLHPPGHTHINTPGAARDNTKGQDQSKLRSNSSWPAAGSNAGGGLASAAPLSSNAGGNSAPMSGGNAPSTAPTAALADSGMLLDAAQLFAAPSMTHDGPSFLESDLPLVSPSPLDEIAAQAGQTNFLPGRGDTALGSIVDGGTLQRLQTGAGYGGDAPLLSPEEIAAQSQQLAGEISTLRQQGVIANSREGSLIEQLRLDELGPEAEPLRASVQVVEDLYGTFRDAFAVGDGMAEQIDLLKLPLAELALTDPGFLKDKEHPARLLVERLSELASLSPENNPRMEQRIGSILGELNAHYEGDLGVFGEALTQVTELALGLLKQQQRNIQRHVATEEGREKRADAATWVEQLLQAKLPNQTLPRSLLALIDGVLRDHWILAAVRGADEASLDTALEPIAVLNTALLQVAERDDPLDPGTAETLISGLRSSVDQDNFMPPEQTALFDAVLADLTGQNSPELVPSSLGVSDVFAEPGFSERLEQLPRLRRWVRRARELERSSWLVEDLGGGKHRNLQLIWHDGDHTHFAFANEQGQKVHEVNVVQLAHWLSQRVTPLAPSERLSIIERSVFSTLARKQSDLVDGATSDDDAGLDRSQLIDKAQSMLRRARRRGPSHSAIAVHVEGDQAPGTLQQALENAGLNIVARGKLSDSTQGIIVDSAEPDMLQQALREGLNVEADAGIGIAAIDAGYDSADEVWRSVEETAKRGLALAPNTGVLAEREVRPTDLAGAVRTTYERLQSDMPPRLSLRRVLRTRCNDHSQIEEAFQILLDGMPDAGGEMARSAGYHSSALSIALDYIKVSSACRIAEDLTSASRAVPVFNIRVSTDAALHHDFLEFVLNEVSQSGIGTDRLCLEFRDSARLREESRVADFARTLRSIGCLIAVCDVNPARGSTSELQVMSPHMLALDASLWPPSESDDRLTALHQAISDLHHLVGEHVVLRDNRERDKAAQLGIDFVEFFDPEEMDPPALAEHMPTLQR